MFTVDLSSYDLNQHKNIITGSGQCRGLQKTNCDEFNFTDLKDLSTFVFMHGFIGSMAPKKGNIWRSRKAA